MNQRYFIRFTKNGIASGLDVFGHELERYIMAMIRKGYIVTGIELYQE